MGAINLTSATLTNILPIANGGTGVATGLSELSASNLNAGTVALARLSGITNAQLSGTAGITNANLANSTIGVTAGTGLSGGGTPALGGSTTLNLANTAVTAGSYTNTNITVDAQGRVTAAANGSAGGVTSIIAGTGIDVSGTTGDVTVTLEDTMVAPDSYVRANITVDQQGRIIAASDSDAIDLSGAEVTGILALSHLEDISTMQLSSNAGITNGQLANSSVTINGTMDEIETTSSDVALGDSATLSLVATGVTAASYTNASITVDAKGRITSASNGSTDDFASLTLGAEFTLPTDGVFSVTDENSELALVIGDAADGGVRKLYDESGTVVLDFQTQGAAVTAASGGDVQDAEARTAINAVISRLQAYGLVA